MAHAIIIGYALLRSLFSLARFFPFHTRALTTKSTLLLINYSCTAANAMMRIRHRVCVCVWRVFVCSMEMPLVASNIWLTHGKEGKAAVAAATTYRTKNQLERNGEFNTHVYCAIVAYAPVCVCAMYALPCICVRCVCMVWQCKWIPKAIVCGVLTQRWIQKNQLIGVVHAVSIVNTVRCDRVVSISIFWTNFIFDTIVFYD